MSKDDAIVIVQASRTAIGNFNGCFSKTPAHLLGAEVINALIKNTSINTEEVSEVILGQVLTSNCGQNPARQASIHAGLNKETPAWIVNQVCGSGLKAIALGMQSLLTNESKIVIAGGQENMSLAPHASYLRSGIKMGNAQFEDTMIKDGLWEAFNNYHMGVTAENIAKEFQITREQQDIFAANSQQKAEKAQKSGAFKNEIIPVTIKTRKEEKTINIDEFPRHGTTAESLSKLKAVFDKEGTVTAGNASGINDGAAAVMLMKASEAEKRKITPLAKITAFAQAGVEPKIMGTGPIPATKLALKKAGWDVEEVDLVEANEAFAAQAIAVNKNVGWDESKVNINGGAIALGHPIGASGARVLVTLTHALKNNKAKKGVATLCVGGGMGVAMCIEAVE